MGVTGEMIDLRTVDGDVFDQLIEAEKFIFNNIALSAWIEEGKIFVVLEKQLLMKSWLIW